MITFLKLGQHGNLGNSMFQLAATYGTAVKKEYKLKIPVSKTYFNPDTNSNITSLFDGFDINLPIITKEDINLITNQYEETEFNYQSSINNIQDFTNLHGYFQTEKYFSHVKTDIKNIFKFKDYAIQESNNLFISLNIAPEDTTSIHIRRNDYIQKQQYHPQQDSSYFFKAAELSRLKQVLIFSDDIEWCKKTFTGKNIYFSNLTSCFSDLRAMSLCKNNIIVNSTFSWWGAWLNDNKNKKIIAPKKWFGPAYSHFNTADILPENWIKI